MRESLWELVPNAQSRSEDGKMVYSEMSDEDLMNLFYEGDDLAFAEIHRRFLTPLVGAAFCRLPQMAGKPRRPTSYPRRPWSRQLTRGNGIQPVGTQQKACSGHGSLRSCTAR